MPGAGAVSQFEETAPSPRNLTLHACNGAAKTVNPVSEWSPLSFLNTKCAQIFLKVFENTSSVFFIYFTAKPVFGAGEGSELVW